MRAVERGSLPASPYGSGSSVRDPEGIAPDFFVPSGTCTASLGTPSTSGALDTASSAVTGRVSPSVTCNGTNVIVAQALF